MNKVINNYYNIYNVHLDTLIDQYDKEANDDFMLSNSYIYDNNLNSKDIDYPFLKQYKKLDEDTVKTVISLSNNDKIHMYKFLNVELSGASVKQLEKVIKDKLEAVINYLEYDYKDSCQDKSQDKSQENNINIVKTVSVLNNLVSMLNKNKVLLENDDDIFDFENFSLDELSNSSPTNFILDNTFLSNKSSTNSNNSPINKSIKIIHHSPPIHIIKSNSPSNKNSKMQSY